MENPSTPISPGDCDVAMVDGSVDAYVHYLDESVREAAARPYMMLFEHPSLAGCPPSNIYYQPYPVRAHNLRHLAPNTYTLATHGFEIAKVPTRLDLSQPDDATMQQYYDELRQKLRDMYPNNTGIDLFYDRRRKNTIDFPALKTAKVSPPLHAAHRDFTSKSATERLDLNPGNRDNNGSRTWEIINFWRVLDDPCNTRPMSFCDAHSVDDDKDLLVCDFVKPDQVQEAIRSYHNPRHRWLYLRDQRRDEVFIFRLAHSKDLKLPCPVHAALKLDQEPVPTPRDVIQVVFVVYF